MTDDPAAPVADLDGAPDAAADDVAASTSAGWIERRWPRRAAALVAGLAICFAMPPWGWWPLAPVGLGLWAVLLDRPRWTQRFWVGALVGLGWFEPSTLWMVKFSPVGWPVGVGVWFPAVCGAASALCPAGRRRFAALAGTVVFSEWLRWHAPFGGVPLSMVAVTQARGPLLPIARLGGSLLISGAVAGFGTAVAAGVTGWRRLGALRAVVPAAVTTVVLIALVGVAHVVPRATDRRSIRVAAVQGGGEQETRSFNTDYRQVLQRHLDASERIRTPVDLVVWPENIVNVVSWEGSEEQYQVRQLAIRLHTTVVVGVVEGRGDLRHFWNMAIAVGPDGREVARYEKVRRVPFGEYVPMRFLLDPLARGLLPPRDAVPGTAPAILDTPVGRLGVAVSWEVYFNRRIRNAALHDAALLLNPTNGSSYWLTQVQSQQIAMSTLRAVETDRWLVQAAPTGFSAIIDPDGVVHQRSGLREAAVLQQSVALRDGRSIETWVGDVPALLLAALAVAAAWWRPRHRGDATVGS